MFLCLSLASLGMGEFFPFGCRGERFQILKSVAVHGFIRGPDDAAEIDQGLLIHLILAEQFHVVAEIAQEPIEFPEGAFSRVKPTGEGSMLERRWLQHNESDLQESLLRMPSVGSPFDADQKQAFDGLVAILLTGMEARDMRFIVSPPEGVKKN